MAQGRPDLVVLDINMPRLNGLETCRRLRAQGDIPILFLSSRDDEIDRVLGIELGGDDYVVKPFSPREVVARITAILRRTGPVQAPPREDGAVVHGRLSLDPAGWRARWDEKEAALTVTEFSILRALAASPSRVFTRDAIIDRLHGPGFAITDRTIDSHIRNLRGKFAALGANRHHRDQGRGRLSSGNLHRRAHVIGAAKALAKRYWPALRLRTILLAVLLFAAAMPGLTAIFLRVYENTLVRQTEAELVAQSAALAAVAAIGWPGANPAVEAVSDPSREREEYYRPENTTIDLRGDVILPERPKPAVSLRPPAADAVTVAARLDPVIQRTVQTTLASVIMLDVNGQVVRGPGRWWKPLRPSGGAGCLRRKAGHGPAAQ